MVPRAAASAGAHTITRMTDFHEGQAVTVPDREGDGRVDATYVGREEDDVEFDAARPTRDWHWVRYSHGDLEGTTDLFPRADITRRG